MKLQERYNEPWQMLVVCILLNRARGEQVLVVANELFGRWPTAQALFDTATWADLRTILKPVGLQQVRAVRIMSLTAAWLQEGDDVISGDTDVRALPGCGQYAWESWQVFQLGRLDIEPEDWSVREYVEQARGR